MHKCDQSQFHIQKKGLQEKTILTLGRKPQKDYLGPDNSSGRMWEAESTIQPLLVWATLLKS